uniref:Uncharacterized protein n=1 Tax=Arundo donax TaxID=35708 RepID=A0A0A8ZCI1_ARUDO
MLYHRTTLSITNFTILHSVVISYHQTTFLLSFCITKLHFVVGPYRKTMLSEV